MLLLKIFAVLLIALPVSIFGTFLLGPLWAWFESAHGIESIGHAMYAGWCFATTYGVLAVAGLLLFVRPRPES